MEMDIAERRGMLPSEWFAASYEDRVWMIATNKAKAIMSAWNAKQAEIKSKRKK